MVESTIYISNVRIQKDGKEEYCVSLPLVMQSAAGFYIGTVCVHTGGINKGFVEPYDRLSYGYYGSKEAAQEELDAMPDSKPTKLWYEYVPGRH